jgi:RNA-directed DNA polymerase
VLERRGHRFVRYADDAVIYVRSERAGQRVMESTCSFIERRLELRVNHGKSSVGLAFKAILLGFGFLRRGSEVEVGSTKRPQAGQGTPGPSHLAPLGRLDGAPHP